ncbi:aminomethyl-transferring glycine dehydrogenase subunit GcvPA [Geothermobacter hydrogeniphilus]|uniref:Probable glycine dehydrogenase (decarboxylating) subunit 1 n=1 Tax=Geothermobacter hydrogeniphilus TaxID=1969733 RepID=A0A1X0XSL8_9BACT|nr:aminomethyl-transferring glycine dehydrogenase subunit GcvPA [Geothermobacter hydrogeniphilus]ORJ55912.1 glycine dehydrogenase (aminomethyl-transferring) [Geothermobacter hydrogeniphilus]
MRYLPHTDDDIRQMLEAIGVSSVDELFSAIPAADRLQRPLDLPPALSEPDLLRELDRLAELNTSSTRALSFLGGGAYNHFIPAAVDHLISRSEFYTAYTPYQPEISQGTLQAIFEYQTLICQLTGMDVANASMYDGASATAEAALMAVRATRRSKLLLSAGLHPEYRQTVSSYCRYLGLELVEVTLAADGRTDLAALSPVLDTTVAAVIVGYPNFYGVIEPLADLADKAHACGAMLVSATAEPVSLGLLKSPGELGVDIAVGEGQSFGLPVAYGGPGVGFFAARKKAVRSMPGRLIGETLDKNGERGFVLTLATREQHIRREKATSNICSNQGLCALMVAIYLALLGKQGIRELAEQNLAKAEYAKRQIASLPGFSLPHQAPTFNEFVVATPRPAAELLRTLEADNILGGIDLARFDAADANRLLVCVTEQNSRDDIDRLVAALKGGAA